MNATPRRGTQCPSSEESERRELAELLPPPAVPGLDEERQLLLRREVLRRAAADGAEAAPPAASVGSAVPAASPASAGRAPSGRPTRRSLRFRIAVPALACGLAAVGVVALDLGGAVEPDRAVVESSAAGTSEAGRLLGRIALAAAEAEQPALRADQFVYIESRVAFAGQSAAGGPVTTAPAHTRQVWLSADGSRPGLLREDGGPDSPLREDGPVFELDRPGATPRPHTARPVGPSIAEPTHAYVASLPTDPDALLKLIREQTRTEGRTGAGQDPDQRAFAAIGDLLAETWAPPQVGAALYRAAERISGVTVVPSAGDAAGREGVAVARTAHGQQTQWIFDRTTYAFLGERTVLSEAGDAGPAGTVLGTSAVLTRGAVDRVGELPLEAR
ncbi:CU044_5270 family protein [Kitasatospora sp. NPDC001132]